MKLFPECGDSAEWVESKSQNLLKVKSGLFFNKALWKIAELLLKFTLNLNFPKI